MIPKPTSVQYILYLLQYYYYSSAILDHNQLFATFN